MNHRTNTKCLRGTHASLRRVLATSIVALFAAAALAQDTSEQKERVAEARILAQQEAESYTIQQATDAKEQLTLLAQPIQHWTNPVDGEIHGSVFIWTRAGRPEVVASIYRYYSPKRSFEAEFQSLSEESLIVKKKGKVVWRPPTGIKFKPIADSTKPANSPAGRIRQMRLLTRRFTAEMTDYENIIRPRGPYTIIDLKP
jgi:hypothetical protein